MSAECCEFRDMSVPYTDAEIEELRPAFQAMSTYNADGDYILTSDFAEFCKIMKFERTPEQVETYCNYYTKNHDGKLPWDFFADGLKVVHDTGNLAAYYAGKVDKDGDGFISKDEFVELFQFTEIHDPRLTGVSYDQFVAEADIDEDGKVSVDECAQWLQKFTEQAE